MKTVSKRGSKTTTQPKRNAAAPAPQPVSPPPIKPEPVTPACTKAGESASSAQPSDGSAQPQKGSEAMVRARIQDGLDSVETAVDQLLQYSGYKVHSSATLLDKLTRLEFDPVNGILKKGFSLSRRFLFDEVVRDGRVCVLNANQAFGGYGEQPIPLEALKIQRDLDEVANALLYLLACAKSANESSAGASQ